ncbi:MAG TPA: holo-ACP synthase [Longimicrobium sp.]|nr:holo-ACP synthase [Longimicrobium sp.]
MAIGVDLVEVARIRRVLERHPAFALRHFTEGERSRGDELPEARRAEFLAGRFAAKEAALKALGTGISGGVSLAEVETGAAPSGAPVLRLSGAALRAAEELGVHDYQVSISHDGGFAVAFVVLS